MKKTNAPRRWPLWLLLGILLLAGAFYLDATVQAWMARHQVPAMTKFMEAVSWWGDWPQHVVVALLGALVAYALGSRRWIMIFAAMVLACALAGITNRAIKIGAGRARPTVTEDAGWHGPRFGSKYNSFPSGHTAATTAFFATLLLARRRVGLIFLPVPILIAISRLYLNAHHFSDVVGGAFVGVLAALVTWHFITANMLDTRTRPRGLLG